MYFYFYLYNWTNSRWLAETVGSQLQDAALDDPPRLQAVLDSITNGELNRESGFYPFVFSRETGECVGHGSHAEFVGLTMEEIFEGVHLTFSSPIALRERCLATDRDWVSYLWSDDGREAQDKLAYIVNNITDATGEQSFFLGVGFENEPLPLDLPCSDRFDGWCGLTNVRSLVGRAQFELERSYALVDFERNMYRISNDERYKAPGGFYLFMYSFDSGLVAHGVLRDGSFGKTLPDIIVDKELGTAEEGQALHERFKDAVSGDRKMAWVQYPWRDSPDGDMYTKVAFLVRVQFDNEPFYLGAGFRFATDDVSAAPLGDVCSDQYNLPCSFRIAYQLSSHSLVHATSNLSPKDEVFRAITHDSEFKHGDFYVFVYNFNGHCVAHGGDESFVGMTLGGDFDVFKKVGIPLNATQLHLQFREAAAKGGGWVKYDWGNLKNPEEPNFKKISYIFQITVDGEDYYGGIGFNHLRHPLEEFSQRGLKLNGDPIPCSRKFGDKCSKINAQAILGQAVAELTLSSSEASSVEIMDLVFVDFSQALAKAKGSSPKSKEVALGREAGSVARLPMEQVFKSISSKDPRFRVNDFSVSVFSFENNQACDVKDGSGCMVAGMFVGSTWKQFIEEENALTIDGALLHQNLIDASNGAGVYTFPYEGTNKRAWVAQFKHEGERYYAVADILTAESGPTCLSPSGNDACPVGTACTRDDQAFCEPTRGPLASVVTDPAFIAVLLLLLASIPLAVYLVRHQKRKAKKQMTEVQKKIEAMNNIDMELGDIDKVVEEAKRRRKSLIMKRAALQDDTPSTWTKSLDTLVSVPPEDEEYWAVIEKIRITIPDAHISKLWRVQNSSLWSYYLFHKDRFEKNDIVTNERRVWHGTSTLNPAVVYGDQMDGFMMQYAAQGLWGRGIYFADKASYSKNYSHSPYKSQPKDRPSPVEGELEMFQARLLVGKEVELSEDRSLTVPPRDPSRGLKYNAVTGHTNGSQVWIVYENGRAYPEYLVRYYIGNRDASRTPYQSKEEARENSKRRKSDFGLNELTPNSQPSGARQGLWEYLSESGWAAYDASNQVRIEKTFQDLSRDRSLPGIVAIKGPDWKYEVNVKAMVQTNTQHSNHRQREIRFHTT